MKAMGPFVSWKVARLNSQRVTVEDPDGLRGHGRWVQTHTVHANHLAPFVEPYVNPWEITTDGTEKIPEPV